MLLPAGTAFGWDPPHMCALDAPTSEDPARVAVPEDEVMCVSGSSLVPNPAERGEPDPGDARRALAEARRLAEAGRVAEALIQLDLVDHAMPRIRDRIALLRGELLLEQGRAPEACAAYEIALRTPDPATAARARVGRVRCAIARGDRRASEYLRDLVRRYPALPEEVALRFELAQAKHRMGDRAGAAALYREIDLQRPGHPLALHAREQLTSLAASGYPVRALNDTQRVDRAERLAQSGPFDDARAELEALLARPLSPPLRARTSVALARIARIEGNFAQARDLLRQARGGGALPPRGDTPEEAAENAQALAEMESDLARAAERERESTEDAMRDIRALVGGARTYGRVPTQRLLAVIRIASREGLVEQVDRALDALAPRRAVLPAARFEAAILSAGVGTEDKVAAVLEPILGNSALGVAARYHYARALERAGRYEAAEAQHLRVIADDRSETRWYKMWSEQRVQLVREAMVAQHDWQGPTLIAALENGPTPTPPRRPATPPADPPSEIGMEPNQDSDAPAQTDLRQIATLLEPIAERHGEAFPWIPRALDLVRLGEGDAAADELHEAFAAWRQARNMPVPRTGVEAVYRLDSRPRIPQGPESRRARAMLDDDSRETLADVAHLLGDEGTAVGFGGHRRAGLRPRAYARLVEAAAARHHLDPNLLFAVMRVESIYQRRVVSYAGAIGLMQIMPRTGALIADRLGHEDFTTEKLLDPALNLDFAAWYLASLIDRFDGNIALAVAAYNGGPHNVRRWLADHHENMPLEAFCERIPFEQTHRYVRRVLTHYRAYRAQQNLPMRELPVVLPRVEPDPMAF